MVPPEGPRAFGLTCSRVSVQVIGGANTAPDQHWARTFPVAREMLECQDAAAEIPLASQAPARPPVLDCATSPHVSSLQFSSFEASRSCFQRRRRPSASPFHPHRPYSRSSSTSRSKATLEFARVVPWPPSRLLLCPALCAPFQRHLWALHPAPPLFSIDSTLHGPLYRSISLPCSTSVPIDWCPRVHSDRCPPQTESSLAFLRWEGNAQPLERGLAPARSGASVVLSRAAVGLEHESFESACFYVLCCVLWVWARFQGLCVGCCRF